MQELEILSVPNLYTLRVCTEMREYIHQLEDKNRPEHDHNYISKTTVHHHATRHATQRHCHVTHDMEHYTRQFTDVLSSLILGPGDTHTHRETERQMMMIMIRI